MRQYEQRFMIFPMKDFNNAEGSDFKDFHDDDDIENLQCIQFVKRKMYLMSSKKFHKDGKEEVRFKYFDMDEQTKDSEDYMNDDGEMKTDVLFSAYQDKNDVNEELSDFIKEYFAEPFAIYNI
jgi:hypothetical protein